MSKTPTMDAQGLAIMRSLVDGEVPGPIPGEKPETWKHHKGRLGQGGSDNHPLLAATVDYIRNGRDGWGYAYLLERGWYELRAELELREGTSGTYGPLHLGPWASIAVLAGRRGDERLGQIARAIVQRMVVLRSIMSTVTSSGVACWAPGQRFDAGTTTGYRWLEGGLVALCSGLPCPWDRVGTPIPPGVAILRGLKSVDGLPRLLGDHLAAECARVIRVKDLRPTISMVLGSIRLATPLTWWRTSVGFAAVIKRGTHGQDPPALGVWVTTRDAKTEWRYLYPPKLASVDPAEEAWAAESGSRWIDGRVEVSGQWQRRTERYNDRISFAPVGSSVTIGSGDPPATISLPPFVAFPKPTAKPDPEPEPEPPPGPELRPIVEIAAPANVRRLSNGTMTAAVQALLAVVEGGHVQSDRLQRAAKRLRAELEKMS